MKVKRSDLTKAIRELDEKIPSELESYWKTVRLALDDLPEETLCNLFGSIARELGLKNQCLLIRKGDDIGIVTKFKAIRIPD